MVTTVLGGVSTVTGIINNFGLGGVDPQKEAERISTIDTLKRDAIASRSTESIPYVRLACWAGAAMGSASYNLAVSYGMVEPGQVCRVGSDSALAYAKAAKLVVDAALRVGGVVQPIINDVMVDHVMQQARSALPFVLGAAALVGLAWLALRKGG